MIGVMGHVVKISVRVSGFLWMPVDSVVLVVSFCSLISRIIRTSRQKIEDFRSFSIVN